MDSAMPHQNPLKRTFDMITSSSSSSLPPSVSLEDDDGGSASNHFIPRGYQSEVFEVAKKRNTIAVLETGAGKTMIAILLIQQIGQAIKSTGVKKLIVFLAPTVYLVKQQYNVIKSNTTFEVGEYTGAKGVDNWTIDCWKKEIDEHDVLVMTPQVLLDALRKAFLSLELVSLIIIDECHHATGNHPYAKIMKEFYHDLNKKPKVFGMTASPVVRKGVSSSVDCEVQISELEGILDCQVYTPEDRTEMDVYVPSTRHVCKFYDRAKFSVSDLKAKIEASLFKFDASILNLRESIQSDYKDVDENIEILRDRLSKDRTKILSCLEELGVVCAYEAVQVCLENFIRMNKEYGPFQGLSLQCKYFLDDVFCTIGESMPSDDYSFSQSGFNYSKAVDFGFISPKLNELLQIFLSLGGTNEVLCLIFVEKKITAIVIERFVKKVACLHHFTVKYLTGTKSELSRKMQNENINSLRAGKVNLMFCTDVLEEGIDVPSCSCVICFNLPKRVSSYIQSRGRARQADSQFIIMLERGNDEQRTHMFDIIRSEWSMRGTAANRDPDVWTSKACAKEATQAYFVDSSGASITADSSVTLISQYCDKLPKDRYYKPRPLFEYEYFEQLCKCTIKFPPNAAFQTVAGPVCKNKQLAKQLVCLEACKKLHQMGALDDHLQLSIEDISEDNPILKTKEKSPGAGTTKRKELHGTACIRALSGSWGEKPDGVSFNAYKFEFSCSIESEIYPVFILLIESKLDEDVGNFELDLYLVRKMIKTSVSSCGHLHLDSEQMTKAKCFQEFFFNALFGKLFTGPKSAKELLFKGGTSSLWNSSNMYLLLPLEMPVSSNNESWRINWSGIDACCSIVELLKKSFVASENCINDGSLFQQVLHNTSVAGCSLIDVNNVKGNVVLAIHSGRLYSVVEVESNKTAESPFDESINDLKSKHSTFADYFKKKYQIVLRYPGQPLLRLKQSHNPHNLLVDFNEVATKNGKAVGKQQQHVYMPPELLLKIDIPVNVLKSMYLLPSLMHRLESLMLASQLRQEIGYCTSTVKIPSSLILEAITTIGCCESFSMERLELLGDSVLKYATSCKLFLTHQNKHEGHLSSWRSQIVCNSMLHKLGTDCKLQGYIRDCPFDPRRWVAPGQQSLHPVPCTCGVDTPEVPLDSQFLTEDPKVKFGKSCDMGHRWMGSKTISDCVEALIGAYYIGGSLDAALHLMKWLGIDAEIDPSLVIETINSYSLHSYFPKEDEVQALESKLGYTFSAKFLLQEAVTHPSMQQNYCYERLEFLGDSVLDFLITLHLYQRHIDIDPGLLTDLRSASVCNENFAQVAVRYNLYQHLQHCSTLLQSQITEYVHFFNESSESITSLQGPKVLGDLVEGIAGAILIDTKFNLDGVWKIFMPLLSPIVTPENLQLPPLRELIELCGFHGYFVKEKSTTKGNKVHVELKVQLNDDLLFEEGSDEKRKAAAGKAASLLLKKLEERGITYSRCGLKRRKLDGNDGIQKLDANDGNQKLEDQSPAGPEPSSSANSSPLVIQSIKHEKGGPRMTLFELCKKAQWPMPTFNPTETKSRHKMEFGEGKDKRTGFSSFVSTISLNIPGFGIIECTGDSGADKKSSFDSAAVSLLHKLQEQGLLIIGGSK